jgi:tRNA-Thr(GGU) m(6)t(6)A37 methyltransferase TsaA
MESSHGAPGGEGGGSGWRDEVPCWPIGRVVSPITAPQDRDWGQVRSVIEVAPDFRPGLLGLSEFSHALVVTFLHGAHYEPERHLTRRPQGREDMPVVGIFAQRAKDRPNPIGITAVRIVSVADGRVTVAGLDAIDGTPVLDIKPYYPQYDAPQGVAVPGWVDRLMKDYF